MSTDPKSKIVSAVLADPVVKAAVEAKAKADKITLPEETPIVVAGVKSGEHTIHAGQVGEKTGDKPNVMVLPSGQAVAVPTTTEEEDRVSQGQRTVNMIWETTQSRLALAVVYVVLLVAAFLSLAAMLPYATEKQVALAITAFMLLSSLSTLVIGFYYGRTNHQRTGGVGKNDGGR